MAVLPIRIYPDPVLRQKAPAVEALDATIQRLLDDMVETMYAAPGIGLAAPQVGVSLRLFVVDISSGRDSQALMIFINPEICHSEGRLQEDEGCLSFPGIYGPTPRAARVRLRGMNRAGETIEVAGEGLLARAFQHEMDHLDGRLFFNRMGPVGRDIVMRKFKRAQRQHQHDH
jgi:peptide deformylase